MERDGMSMAGMGSAEERDKSKNRVFENYKPWICYYKFIYVLFFLLHSSFAYFEDLFILIETLNIEFMYFFHIFYVNEYLFSRKFPNFNFQWDKPNTRLPWNLLFVVILCFVFRVPWMESSCLLPLQAPFSWLMLARHPLQKMSGHCSWTKTETFPDFTRKFCNSSLS